MPASGFITYEKLVLAYYNGVSSNGAYNNNSDVEYNLELLRNQLLNNGVDATALKNYENVIVAQNNNMIGASYDGDNVVNDVITTMRNNIINSYTGP